MIELVDILLAVFLLAVVIAWIAMAAAYFAGGFWETTAQERLEIRYAIDGGSLESLPVNFDVRDLAFRETRITSLILPEGLTRLESLSVANNQLTNLT